MAVPREIETIIKETEELLSKQPERTVSVPRKQLEGLISGISLHLAEAANRNEELQRRLEEAEQTIDAIRKGEVDAIVHSDQKGSRIYTLEGPDHPYRNIVETMNAGAVTIDQRGTIFYSNSAFSRMIDMELEGLIGSSFTDLVVDEDRSLFLDFLTKTGKMEKRTEEIRLKGRKGQLFVRLAGNRQTVYDIERTSIVITDISALKSAEESLRKEAHAVERERDRLMTLIDSMNDGVWFADTDGRIALVNAVAKLQSEEAGLDTDTLSQSTPFSPLSRVDILTPDGEKPFEMEPLMRVFQGEPFREVEMAVRNRTTGEVFFRKVSANPILDRKKRVEGVITVVRDITAEKRAAIEKVHLEEQLRQSQKMEAIGTLAGGIAHDFNNMLAVIMGNAELALDETDGNEATRRNIEQIVKASKRARDLVKQILAFSRKTERGKKPLKLTPLLKETYVLLRGSLPATVTIELDLGTDKDTVISDPSQIQQIVMNLATNAAHAMRDKGGTLTLGLSNATLSKDGPLPDREIAYGSYVKLTVRDTGKGMTDKIKKRIFDPFFTTKPIGQGTGMGLAVVYGIVKSHEGAITVESYPGKGSTFDVFLPYASEPAKQEEREEDLIPHGKERILLVDDEPLVVEITSGILRNLGYDVTTAENGVQALEIFLNEPDRFDLVITDQTMPGVTGMDVAKRMLQEKEDVPIILFTGYSEVVSAEKAKAAGIREFVMKPVAKRDIARAIRRVLDARKEPKI
jgi:PAS domain S-box-containing protein